MNKLLAYHPRFWIAVVTGIAVYFCLPGHWSVMSRVLVGWNCGVDLFLILVFVWMSRLTAAQCALRVERYRFTLTYAFLIFNTWRDSHAALISHKPEFPRSPDPSRPQASPKTSVIYGFLR